MSYRDEIRLQAEDDAAQSQRDAEASLANANTPLARKRGESYYTNIAIGAWRYLAVVVNNKTYILGRTGRVGDCQRHSEIQRVWDNYKHLFAGWR